MPVVKRQDSVESTKPATQFTLPTQKSKPKASLSEYVTLIYGERKIGKTSLASQFPDVLFLMFEPGGKGLSIYQRGIKSWLQFKAYIDLLKKDTTFKTVVVDTAEAAYECCFEYVCKREGMGHPSEEEWGAGWKAISREFVSTMNSLVDTGKGVIFIGHSKTVDIKKRGQVINTYVDTEMSKPAYKYLTAIVDNWFYYGYVDDKRVLVIRGTESVGAGTRPKGHFLTTGGDPIQTISMGNSEEQAYANLVAAFENKLKNAGRPYIPEGGS